MRYILFLLKEQVCKKEQEETDSDTAQDLKELIDQFVSGPIIIEVVKAASVHSVTYSSSCTKHSHIFNTLGKATDVLEAYLDVMILDSVIYLIQPGLAGKAMVVAMSREICARLYDVIVKLRPGWHDAEKDMIKVVMTGLASN